MSDFNLTITIRNNHILTRVREQYGTIAEMCRKTGMPNSRACSLLTMREQPFKKNGELSAPAEYLCSALGATPSDLWPMEMAKVKAKRASHEINLSMHEALAIAGDDTDMTVYREAISRWAKDLTPREIKAISIMQSGSTLEDIGSEIGGVSRERTRQILNKAFRKMKRRAGYDRVTCMADLV